MAHHDDIILASSDLAENPSFGSAGGPRVELDVIHLGSGFRKTNRRWSQHLRRYALRWDARDVTSATKIRDLYEALEGPQDSWLIVDPNDWNTGADQGELSAAVTTAGDQPLRNTVTLLFTGDGATTTFDCVQRKTRGAAAQHTRDVKKPKSGTLKIAVNGVTKTEGADYTVNYATGRVTFTVFPPNGQSVTWGGEFYVPVAFAELDFELETIEGELRGGSAELVEVRL